MPSSPWYLPWQAVLRTRTLVPAKAHIRHVYRKLDVHDRDALFAAVKDYLAGRRG